VLLLLLVSAFGFDFSFGFVFAAGFCLWLRGFIFGFRFQLRCWFCCWFLILVSVSASVLVSLLASAFGFGSSSDFGVAAGFGFWFRFLKWAAAVCTWAPRLATLAEFAGGLMPTFLSGPCGHNEQLATQVFLTTLVAGLWPLQAA